MCIDDEHAYQISNEIKANYHTLKDIELEKKSDSLQCMDTVNII